MTNTLSAEVTSMSPQEAKKLRQKQAKREAELMLKVEQAKKDVEKARRKMAKAQSQLDESTKAQQQLEDKLSKLRTTGQQELEKPLKKHSGEPEQPVAASSQPSDTSAHNGHNMQSEPNEKQPESAETSTPTNQVAAIEPAEGHVDPAETSSNGSTSSVGGPESDAAPTPGDTPPVEHPQSSELQNSASQEAVEPGTNEENDEHTTPKKRSNRRTRKAEAKADESAPDAEEHPDASESIL